MKNFFFALLLFAGYAAFAQEPVTETPVTPPVTEAAEKPAPVKIGEVTQIFKDKKRLIVNLTDGLAPGERPPVVVISFSNGEACEGKVVQSDLTKMLAEFPDCSAFDKVKVGMATMPPAFTEPPPAVAATPEAAPATPEPAPPALPVPSDKNKRARFSLSVGYASAGSLDYNSIKVTTSNASGTGKSSFEIKPALQMSFGVLYAPVRNWGFSGNFTLEGRRDVRSAKLTADNGQATTIQDDGTTWIQFNLFEANAHYRWEKFYLPFGLNYSSVDFSPPGSGILMEFNGALGAQAGVGWIVANDLLKVEALAQMISNSLKISDSTTTVDFGTGHLVSVVLRFAVLF